MNQIPCFDYEDILSLWDQAFALTCMHLTLTCFGEVNELSWEWRILHVLNEQDMDLYM